MPLPVYSKNLQLPNDANGTPVELFDSRDDLYNSAIDSARRTKVRIKNLSPTYKARIGTEDWMEYILSPGEILELELHYGVRFIGVTGDDGNYVPVTVLVYKFDRREG